MDRVVFGMVVALGVAYICAATYFSYNVLRVWVNQ